MRQVELEPLYLYYWLCSQQGQDYLFSRVSQVGVPQIQRPLSTLREASLPVPPLATQKAIVSILGALDDKIELNHRMNANLEAMARALFQSWFVDFDPVRAKLDGRSPVGLDPAIASLFPHQLKDSEIGLIPQGWRIAKLGEFASIIMGQSPPGHTYNADGKGIALINGPVQFDHSRPLQNLWTTHSGIKTSTNGDLIFCVRGSTTGKRVIADGTYALGRGVCAIRSKTPRLQPYTNATIEHVLDNLLAKATGSVFPNLSSQDLVNQIALLPDIPVLDCFCHIVGPYFAMQESNIYQSSTLTALRDTLLPKLLSGELSVRNLESQVAAVV